MRGNCLLEKGICGVILGRVLEEILPAESVKFMTPFGIGRFSGTRRHVEAGFVSRYSIVTTHG